MNKELESLLREGLEILDIDLPDNAPALFMQYLEELKKWNRTYSITSIRDDRDVIISHFLDSAIYLRGLDADIQSLADIGSGGGFPGMPIKILRPEIKVHLVEPNRKKSTFLRMLAGRLELEDLTVHECRLEQCEELQVDAAVTRALFSADDFVQNTKAILNDGGSLVLSKGPKFEEELQGAWYKHEVIDIDLPFSDATRHIIVIKP